MLFPNTILRERYRIISQLGHGGMGAVYQAMDEHLSCLVAVKETFATNDEQRRAFRREAQLLANLTHPTLPRVSDHFTDVNGQFLVMQYVAGHDLAELLKLRDQPFPVAKVLDWADQILDALEELHFLNPPVVHRDIKPANLKLTPKGRVLLLDFGLAKGSAGQMSTAKVNSPGKSIYGYTRSYAPIEQIRGAGTDPRSDLYSLAATLWTLLTNKIPPDAVTRMVELAENNPDPLRPATEINLDVPTSVWNILQRALSINRNYRYEDAAEMRSALGVARDAEVEHQTLPKGDPDSTSSVAQVNVPPLASTTKVPFVASTTSTAEPEVSKTGPLVPLVASTPAPAVVAPFDKHGTGTVERSSETPRVGGPNPRSWGGSFMATTPTSVVPNHERRFAKGLPLIIGTSSIVVVGLILALMAIGLAMWHAWASSPQPSISSNPQTEPQTDRNTNAQIDKSLPSTWANQTGIEFILIPSGSFTMGSTVGEAYRMPAHQVTINYSFYMGRYEVTQAQWQAVMGNNPSDFKDCPKCPVEQVSWDGAQGFVRRLNQLNDGYTYRLPTEAEWEYSCRAGTTTTFAFGDSLSSDQANFDGNYPYGGAAKGVFRKKTTTVGSFRPNDWGLYDMHGNVSEWCEDWYHDTYSGAPSDGSAWLDGGEKRSRVTRGGSWYSHASQMLSAGRGGAGHDVGNGFRVVAVR